MPYDIAIDARKLGDFGIGTYVHQLVLALAGIDRENRYQLLVGRSYDGHFDQLPGNFERVFEPAPGYSLREQVGLSRRLLRLRPDLYHATHYVLPLWTPPRVVTTVHDLIHVLFPQFLPHRSAGLYARVMLRRACARSAALITDSRHGAEDLERHFDVDRARIHPIHPGVAAVFFEPLAPEVLRARLEPLGLRRPYLLFVGNPKPHKNLPALLEAYARASEGGGLDVDLACVGARGGADAAARRLARELGIHDRVRWLGYVEEERLPALYQGARLLAHPSLYEGFGLPVAEAMASGVPVVASRGSATEEVAGGCAELVDPSDPAALAAALVRCNRDEAHRRALAERGRERARTFSWRRAAEQTLAVYRGALREGAPAGAAVRGAGRSA